MNLTETVPSLIFARRALNETLKVLCEHQMALWPDKISPRSLKEEVEASRELVAFGTDCLRAACAARCLRMVAVDAATGVRHALPPEYFDRRWSSAVFQQDSLDLSGLEGGDPIASALAYASGWACGFVEEALINWLRNPEIGPLTGPVMRRPFFQIETTSQEAKKTDPPSKARSEQSSDRNDVPRKEKKLRRDEKRSEIVKAVKALCRSKNWETAQDKDRCRLVEDYLKQRRGFCTVSTLRRAIAHLDRGESTTLPL